MVVKEVKHANSKLTAQHDVSVATYSARIFDAGACRKDVTKLTSELGDCVG